MNPIINSITLRLFMAIAITMTLGANTLTRAQNLPVKTDQVLPDGSFVRVQTKTCDFKECQ